MNLLTFCPACGTAFRITTEQLSISHGDVRCSKCGEVFNGLKSLSFQRKPHREVELPNDALITHADEPEIPETPSEVWDPAATPLPQPSFEYTPKLIDLPPPAQDIPPPQPEIPPLPVFAPTPPEPVAELPPEPKPELEPEPETWSHPVSEPVPEMELPPPAQDILPPQPEIKLELEPVAEPIPEPVSKPSPEPEPGSPPVPEPTIPQAEIKPEPKPEEKLLELEAPPKPEPQPLAPWPEIKLESLPPESKTEEIRLELEPETKPDHAPNLEPWPKLELSLQSKPKLVSKPEPRPIPPKPPVPTPASKPELKPESKPESKPISAPITKPESKPMAKPELKPAPAPVPKHEPPPAPKPPLVPAPEPTPESDSEIVITAPLPYIETARYDAVPSSNATVPAAPDDHDALPPSKKARPWLWVTVCVLALLMLLGQTIFLMRTQIASSLPRTKPLLEQACALIGCTVEFPRDEEALRIEDSDLQPLPDHDDVIQLTATITNKAPFTQAYPLLEVTLTDMYGAPVLRRTLQPQEYLPPGTVVKNGLAAKSDVEVNFMFARGVAATGYKMEIRYP